MYKYKKNLANKFRNKSAVKDIQKTLKCLKETLNRGECS